MKRSVLIFGIMVLVAPVVFFFYYQNNLVCLPRAIASSFAFGLVPFIFLFLAYNSSSRLLLYPALALLVLESAATPIIMLKRLGWEKFASERLLAFFTFEFFIFVQIILVIIVLEKMVIKTCPLACKTTS
jgi:hypothetical protein